MADFGDTVKLDADKHVLLDEPLLRLPYELARNNFRTAHRQIEQSQGKVDELLKASLKQSTATNSTDGSSKALGSLDQAIARLQTLKRKLATLDTSQHTSTAQSAARIQHLDELYHIPMLADVEYDRWSRTRLDRLIVDYLLRQGFMQSAKALAQNRGIEKLVDVDEFENVARIERSLRVERRVELALQWCGENKQALKKIDSVLEYHLRQQQYIELVKAGKQDGEKLFEAVAHARKYLIAQGRTNLTISSAGCMAYAFEENLDEPSFAACFAPDQWDNLTAMFRDAHHKIFCLPKQPLLHTALTAGMSALKTPACHSKVISPTSGLNTVTSPRHLSIDDDAEMHNTDDDIPRHSNGHDASIDAILEDAVPASVVLNTPVCPICSTELNRLARGVPFAMHSKSHVEDNPVVLPNGRIYGRDRLTSLNEKLGTQSGCMADPIEPEKVYQMSQVRKVFIL